MKANFITPVITAMCEDGRPDHKANRAIYDYLIDGGITGILMLGSIGEFFAVSEEDQKEMVKTAVEQVNHRVKLIVGTSSMEAKQAIRFSNTALELGADAVMVLPPYYFGMSDESIEHFYDVVAQQCNGDLYLYNFPDRTGYPIPPNVVFNLVKKHKNIVGIKDSASTFASTREYIKAVLPHFPEFEIYSGFDDNFVHNILSGGCGCISGLSNVAPEICAAWVKAAREDNFVELARIQKIINRMMNLYDVSNPFIPSIKKAMKLRGIELNDISSVPLLSVDENQSDKIYEILKQENLV